MIDPNEQHKYHDMNQSIMKNNQNTQVQKRPDEASGIHVEGHIKIFDPNNMEIIVEKRA
jgi:hypothetical protein